MSVYRIDRRTFLIAGMAGAASRVSAQAPRLETFRQWLAASPAERQQGMQASLDRIKSLDPSIQAWVQVAPQQPTGQGALSGIPFGCKDILETNGLATEYGSAIYKGRIGTSDAAIVRDLRQRGAVLMGKTHTTAFAYKTPAPTRNPRNPDHTPGGSSSGSAAAVALGMVPFANGTQTRGSVLRPASYCGVTGFKPTFDLLPMGGVLPFARSLDTLGLFTHTAADMVLLWEAMGYGTARDVDVAFGVPDPMPEVERPMAEAFAGAVLALVSAGARVQPVDIAEMLTSLDAASNTVMFYEGARFHQERYKEFGTRLGPDLYDLVREGLQISEEQYGRARAFIDASQQRVSALYRKTPIILVPAATGPAPQGLASTGDARMNAPWTAVGTPAISIPMPVRDGLPLGLQLTADAGQDAQLLQAAVRVQTMLG
jgi:Asp-tRNA(Asn)/Glu-tRNA(Gln) amidotransferase A subunit family amidase